jgi:hypothetical protein
VRFNDETVTASFDFDKAVQSYRVGEIEFHGVFIGRSNANVRFPPIPAISVLSAFHPLLTWLFDRVHIAGAALRILRLDFCLRLRLNAILDQRRLSLSSRRDRVPYFSQLCSRRRRCGQAAR